MLAIPGSISEGTCGPVQAPGGASIGEPALWLSHPDEGQNLPAAACLALALRFPHFWTADFIDILSQCPVQLPVV